MWLFRVLCLRVSCNSLLRSEVIDNMCVHWHTGNSRAPALQLCTGMSGLNSKHVPVGRGRGEVLARVEGSRILLTRLTPEGWRIGTAGSHRRSSWGLLGFLCCTLVAGPPALHDAEVLTRQCSRENVISKVDGGV